MEHTGERFSPENSNAYEIKINIERYLFAMQFCKDKIVLDAGCGAGLGSYLYNLLAQKVISADYSEEALENVKKYPVQRVETLKADFEKDILPEHDLTIALEVIEHLENPDFFLSNLKSKELIFSIPLNSLAISKFHKTDFKELNDIRRLIEKYYIVEDYYIQANIWVYAKGTRK